MLDVERKIESERKYLTTEIGELGKRLGNLPRLKAFLERINTLPSVEDLSHVFIGPRIVFQLFRKESTFPRDLVREFGGKFKKTEAWDHSGIECSGDLDGFAVKISGYKPATCELVYEEVLVPATPEHTVTKAKLICRDEEEPV